MAISRLPIAAEIKDEHLANAVTLARIYFLVEWPDSKVISLINLIEHVLNTGRSKFPKFAEYHLLKLIEKLQLKGNRELGNLISQAGEGIFWSGLTLLATAQGQRDIALIAAGKVLAAGGAEAAGKHYKHVHRQRSNARAGGMKSHDQAAPRHRKIEEEILRLRDAGYPERSICSTLARKGGMPSASTIRHIRSKMDDQEK